MFSKSSYLQVPQVSSSLDLNGDHEFLLRQHPHDILSSHYLTTNTQFLEPCTLYNNQDVICGVNEDPQSTMANAYQAKQTAKKDRHSKIVTSQGPRDRRVRLSIGMARKFFDLQEMLGFDKPSKTLEWLLTKSKAAIKELVQMKGDTSTASANNKSISSSQECEVMALPEDGNYFDADSNAHRGRRAKDPQKESRAKARARARERTREKMSMKKLNESINMASDSNPSSEPSLHFPLVNTAAATEDLVQESLAIRRMLKNPSIFGFQQNINQNWGISNFCDIFDHHRFINSSSNM